MAGAVIGDAICAANKDKAFLASHVGIQALCSAKALSVAGGDQDKFLVALGAGMVEWHGKEPRHDRNYDEATLTVLEDKALEGDGWKRSGLRGYNSSSPLARAIPIGVLFQNDPATIVGLARGACAITHEDTTPQCGTVAAAMLVSYATSQIPMGLWGNELSSFVSGLDDDILYCVKRATESLHSHGDPASIMASLGDGSDPATALGMALYICAKFRSKGMLSAIKMAKMVKDPIGSCVVGAIVGACFGVLTGMPRASELPVELMPEVQPLIDSFGQEPEPKEQSENITTETTKP